MEYTTPPSYGSTVVSVGGIATDDKLILANAQPPVSHDETAPDSDNSWPEPKVVTWKWEGSSPDGQQASAELSGSLGKRIDRVDVMGEMPKFVKNIVAGAAGTKPYIYQVCAALSLSRSWCLANNISSRSTPPNSPSRSTSAARPKRRKASSSRRRPSFLRPVCFSFLPRDL